MKKSLQRLGMATVGLSLCLWSCKEQDGLVKPNEVVKVAPQIKENIDFSVVEGRLKFATMEDFKGAIAKNVNQQAMQKWEQNGGFTSMNEAYREFNKQNVEGSKGTERVIDKEYDDVVVVTKDNLGKKNYKMALPVPALAALVNEDGLVQIDDKVFKFSDETVKIAEAQYREELELNSTNSHVIINRVNKHLVNTKSDKSAKVLADWNSDTYVSYSVPSGFSARRFRVRKMFYDYNMGYSISQGSFMYLFVSGVEVEHQRDDWWGWASCDIDGWVWGSGMAGLYTYGSSSISNLQYATPTSWNSSNGIQCQNSNTIFLGTIGFFNSNVAWGEYGIVAYGTSSDMFGYTFGPQQIRDPNNSSPFTNNTFGFTFYR
jgi:hypothetical protein